VHHALISGVSGIVGSALAPYLAARDDWAVTGLSRHAPGNAPCEVLSVDLGRPAETRDRLRGLEQVTHILYCARAPHTRAAKEPVDLNLAMLRNLLEAVEPIAPDLRHVHLVHGSKYYGCELGPYRTPAEESDPRLAEDNWYYAQEDFVIERSRGTHWTWSASRPHGICNRRYGIARSIPMVIAVYAAILKELGQPLHFPGTERNYHALYQCTEAVHLAEAIAWISTEPGCANQAFNVTNGDYIRWAHLWPAFAGFFGMEPGGVKTVRLAEVMVDKAPVWERIVAKHGLVPTPYEKTALWLYGDSIFTPGYDMMSSTLKLRQSGFAACVDTGRMFLDMFAHFRRTRVIP